MSEKKEESGSWPCDRCTFVNKAEDKECVVCQPMTVLMQDNLQHSPTPDCDKIMNDYPTDESSEGDEAKKDEPEAAANEKQEKDGSQETNTAGPSKWKKRINRKRDGRRAKKARAKSCSSSSDEYVNTTLADQFKEKCESSSDDSE